MLDYELVVVLLVILHTLSVRYYLRNWYCPCVEQSVFLDLLCLFSLLRLLFLPFHRLVWRYRCFVARREHLSEELLLTGVQFVFHFLGQEMLVGIHLSSAFSNDHWLSFERTLRSSGLLGLDQSS